MPDGTRLRLRLCCDRYDRLQPLIDGRIQPRGVTIDWTILPIEETLRRLLTTDEFDGGEMSLAVSLIAADTGVPDFVALPLFTSRYFRLSCLFVRADSPLTSLDQLRGARIGVRNYHRATAVVWVRGQLQHDYGIAPQEMTWVVEDGGRPAQADGLPLELPADLHLEPAAADLEQLLLAGEIDVLLALRMPGAFRDGSGAVRRLLPNFQQLDMAYFNRTGIFPIMHNVVLRREVFGREPWIGESLCDAFEAAKALAFRQSYDVDGSHHSLAWYLQYLEEERRVMGPDPWSYGLQANRAAIDTFAGYCHEQGLTRQLLDADRLFAEVPWSETDQASIAQA